MAARLQPRRPERARQVGVSRGSPPGTRRFTALSWPGSTRSGPSGRWCCCLREWYMHPSGQLPAYEWDFSDANPPVHAHAARRVYEITRDLTGEADTAVSRGGLSQAPAQLHLVGQPQGPRGPQRLSGGLSRPGQHRRVRPQPAQPGRGPAARAGRWDRLDGHVLPRHAGDRARAVSHPAGLRGDRHQVFRALRGDLARHQRVRRRDRHVGPASTVSITTCVRVKGGPSEHLKVRSFVGLIPLFADAGDRTGHARTSAPLSPPGGVVPSLSLRSWPATSA